MKIVLVMLSLATLAQGTELIQRHNNLNMRFAGADGTEELRRAVNRCQYDYGMSQNIARHPDDGIFVDIPYNGNDAAIARPIPGPKGPKNDEGILQPSIKANAIVDTFNLSKLEQCLADAVSAHLSRMGMLGKLQCSRNPFAK